jgi:hypothetical protein
MKSGGSKGVWTNSGTAIFAFNGQTNLSAHPSWGKSPTVALVGIPSTSNSVALFSIAGQCQIAQMFWPRLAAPVLRGGSTR